MFYFIARIEKEDGCFTKQRTEPSLVCFRSNPPAHKWNPIAPQIEFLHFYIQHIPQEESLFQLE